MYHSKYWFNVREVWTNFPNPRMDGLMKWYYLVQLAFWLQQIFVINIEERRKDHWQMFSHHIITCILVSASYSIYQVKVGNTILCIMDLVDTIFAVSCHLILQFGLVLTPLQAAKMLRYVGCQTACDIAFGLFLVTWFVTRHVFYLTVCWSVYVDLPVMTNGCYSSASGEKLSDDGGNQIGRHLLQSFRDPGGVVCWNDRIGWSFLGLLLALQVILLIWFGMIWRVAYKVIRGCPADDSRSDDEGEEEEEEVPLDLEKVKGKQPKRPSPPPTVQTRPFPKPLEEEVGAESLHFSKRKSMRPQRRSSGRSSGITIPGHSDRKDILDRIGCERKTNE